MNTKQLQKYIDNIDWDKIPESNVIDQLHLQITLEILKQLKKLNHHLKNGITTYTERVS